MTCDIKACRICLRSSNIKLYGLTEFNLKKYYEGLHGKRINTKDSLPCWFCYQCAALLHKFHKFKEKSNYSQKTFKELIKHGLISYESIDNIIRENVTVFEFGTLDIVSSNDKVKTFKEKHVTINPGHIVDKSFMRAEEVVLDCDDNFYSDDDESYDDPKHDPVAEEEKVNDYNEDKKDVLETQYSEKPNETEKPVLNTSDSMKVELKVEESSLLTNQNAYSKDHDDECQDSLMNGVKTSELLIATRNLQQKKQKPYLQENADSKKYDKSSRIAPKNLRQRKQIVYSVDDDEDSLQIELKTKEGVFNKKLRRKKYKTSSDYEAEYEEVQAKKKVKESNVISPETKKYKFKSKNGEIKAMAFLNSGFWKKTSLSEEEALKEFEAKRQDRKYLNAAFKCTDCFKGFSKKVMLDRHKLLRHGEAAGPVFCRFCNMRFKSSYFINKHMRQHYTKYECLRCNLVCNLENSALFHEEYHNGVIRKCIHCDKEFRHLSSFYTHLRTHRSKHMCSLCGESFVSELGLRLHKNLKHVVETENQESAIEENTYCETCQIKFETKEAFDKHLVHSAMHTDDNKVLDDDGALEYLDDDDKEENGQKSKPLLKRRSRVEKNLSAVRKLISRRSTTIKKPTTCHQCGKAFETQSACMKHHLAMHPGTSFFSEKERIICEICGASLAPGSVAAHLNQHTRSKMFTCDTCGRSFTTNTMLRNHMVVHTGEKKFACSQCDKRFTQNGSLSLHYRTFHLKQPYPKRNRRKKNDNLDGVMFNGKEHGKEEKDCRSTPKNLHNELAQVASLMM